MTVHKKFEQKFEQGEISVLVTWILENKNGVIKNYNVTYFRVGDSLDRMSIITKEMWQNFEDLKARKTYEFQARLGQIITVTVLCIRYYCIFAVKRKEQV